MIAVRITPRVERMTPFHRIGLTSFQLGGCFAGDYAQEEQYGNAQEKVLEWDHCLLLCARDVHINLSEIKLT